ncbi:hypothetical protein F2P81_001627 [Scophthalmus maximus]|uniref:Uncharacterized protein n=1 Tax=Scophthalmus maximus TaxID=52904 RepID=A0A6A4TKU2_SCOMX|nr:hypothetical protein F2P81_001627 [Scophthalmus maximus]
MDKKNWPRGTTRRPDPKPEVAVHLQTRVTTISDTPSYRSASACRFKRAEENRALRAVCVTTLTRGEAKKKNNSKGTDLIRGGSRTMKEKEEEEEKKKKKKKKKGEKRKMETRWIQKLFQTVSTDRQTHRVAFPATCFTPPLLHERHPLTEEPTCQSF